MTDSRPAPGTTSATPARVAEITAALVAVRTRIARACTAAGRNPDSVTLVAVTKTRPAADVRVLVDLGITDVGENRDSEAAAKADELRGAPGVAPRWHLVGQLQTNKVRSVLGWADVVHSVDRDRLVLALDRGAAATGRVLDCFVQVDLREPAAIAADSGRGGVSPEDLARLCDAVAAAGALRLRGLMAVAPLGASAGPAFERLAGLSERIRADHPAADALSAGMSGDLEAALAAGATHVRLGSALLGSRPLLH